MNYKLTNNLELVPTRNNYKFFSIGLFVVLIALSIIFFFREESIKIVYKVVHPTTEQSKDVELSNRQLLNVYTSMDAFCPMWLWLRRNWNQILGRAM